MTNFLRRYLLSLAIAAALHAQGVTPDLLLKPPADTWPAYHGDYSGRRHSALTQITPANVGNLSLAWVFQSGQNATLKSSPLVVDGVIYITVPDNVWAVDALSGRQLWHYTYPKNTGFHIGSRGVSMYKEWLYFMTPDSHLICLNAHDGTVRWNVAVADANRGYWTTMSPLIVGNHVIVGVSGDFDNLTGFLKSVDPETGKTQWRWDATPPAGTPNASTGGMTWMTGTYDPQLNLIYWGTGNPTPVLNGSARPGDDLYTCSIVALDPETGKLKWAFQPSPHDTHDWDAVETPVLVDADFHGQPRKMLMQTSRNGYFFVLDRTNGKSLLTTTFGPVNWAKGVDAKGQPIPDPAKSNPLPTAASSRPTKAASPITAPPASTSRRACSSSMRTPATPCTSPSPPMAPSVGPGPITGYGAKPCSKLSTTRPARSAGPTRSAAAPAPASSPPNPALPLPATGRATCSPSPPPMARLSGMPEQGGGMDTSPITVELYGRQYVITSGGGAMFAWALPQR